MFPSSFSRLGYSDQRLNQVLQTGITSIQTTTQRTKSFKLEASKMQKQTFSTTINETSLR